MLTAKDLGERQIIDLLIQQFRKTRKMAIPFGDDVAGYHLKNDLIAVLKTDILVGMTDIPPTMSLKQAARKAVVMNISDFAAKGVKPLALLTSLTLPRQCSKEDIEEIGRGLDEGAGEHDTYIIGGDTSEGGDLTICCMVFGIARKNHIILRSGARIGDVIAVTGPFGIPSAGLQILLNNMRPPMELRDYLVERVTMPRARLKEGLALAKTGVVTASIDSSDGLAICLHELKKHSQVGLTITNLPIDPHVIQFAKTYGLNPVELALYGGEEYELVLTISPGGWRKAQRIIEDDGGQLIPIGTVVKGNEVTLSYDNVTQQIQLSGWEHFTT